MKAAPDRQLENCNSALARRNAASARASASSNSSDVSEDMPGLRGAVARKISR